MLRPVVTHAPRYSIRCCRQIGASKIARGHHQDDFIETLLLNQFYWGGLRSMAPKLEGADGSAYIVRPLVLSAESDLLALAQEKPLSIIPWVLCDGQVQLRRREIKSLLCTLE